MGESSGCAQGKVSEELCAPGALAESPFLAFGKAALVCGCISMTAAPIVASCLTPTRLPIIRSLVITLGPLK